MPVARLLKKINQGIKEVYYHAEDLIEEEREIPISQEVVNSVIHRYVTRKVEELEDLHTELHDNWLTLYATIYVKGIRAKISIDLNLVQFHMTRTGQYMVFVQKAPAVLHEASFSQIRRKMLFNVGVFFAKYIKRVDPVLYMLEELDIIKIDKGLITLDIHRYLEGKRKILNSFKTFEIHHAEVKEHFLVINSNVYIRGLLGMASMLLKDDSEDELQEAVDDDMHDLVDDVVKDAQHV